MISHSAETRPVSPPMRPATAIIAERAGDEHDADQHLHRRGRLVAALGAATSRSRRRRREDDDAERLDRLEASPAGCVVTVLSRAQKVSVKPFW